MSAEEKWANFRPPEGFQALPSALEGFEIYGPATGDRGFVGPKAVRCAQCGASARFDVAKQAVACPFCAWVAPKESAVIGRDAADGEFTSAALDEGGEGFGVERRELSCQGCGALIALEEGALAATCPFCASAQVSVREHATARGLRPTALLPFSISADAARKEASRWLGQGWFHPKDLGHLARVDAFVGLYAPYWLFSADLSSTWEAEVGRERTITKRNSEGQTETETVIDWQWRKGAVSLSLKDLLVPGTSKISARLLARVEDAFDLDALSTYDPSLLAGFQAQTYDVGLPDAWEQGRAKMREAARRACMSDTGSSHVRSFSMTADLAREAWRHILIPIWISAYRYEGRTFVVLVDGSTGRIAGQKPIDWSKLYLAVAAALAPGLLLGIIGLPLLLVGIGAFVILAAVVLLIAGAIGAFFLYQHAIESEAL